MTYDKKSNNKSNSMNIVKEIEQRQLEKIEARNEPMGVDEVCGISINEFKKRKIGIEIYSKVLNENIWFCSNEGMAKQIKEDDPTAVCYTSDEIGKLIELNPSKDLLKQIHDTKTVFNPSKLIE